MTVDEAKTALKAVLQEIQSRSGLDCPTLTDSTVPPKALPKFDSTVWPVAITMVARRLGMTIPNDVHIFGGSSRSSWLTVEQSAALICAQAKPKVAVKAAA